jgi:transposase-like protein
MSLTIQIILAIIGSGGLITILGLLIRAYFEKEVKKTIASELTEIKRYMVELKMELGCKQSKEVCTINHNNIDRRLESIEDKLDKLIGMGGTQ